MDSSRWSLEELIELEKIISTNETNHPFTMGWMSPLVSKAVEKSVHLEGMTEILSTETLSSQLEQAASDLEKLLIFYRQDYLQSLSECLRDKNENILKKELLEFRKGEVRIYEDQVGLNCIEVVQSIRESAQPSNERKCKSRDKLSSILADLKTVKFGELSRSLRESYSAPFIEIDSMLCSLNSLLSGEFEQHFTARNLSTMLDRATERKKELQKICKS